MKNTVGITGWKDEEEYIEIHIYPHAQNLTRNALKTSIKI